jgi:aerobic-type carbon monoxide dehydrogenase small subunit (CoxS/CutS family)
MDEKKKKANEEEKERGGPPKVSRRDFLKGMGAGALATTMTSLPAPPVTEAAALPAGVKEAVIQLNVNGKTYRPKVKSNWTLLDVLRRELGLTGSKKGCDRGNCGACTVTVDGKPVFACSLLAVSMEGKKILTVEGLADGGTLHPVQKSFSEHGGYQCGFCTSGQMMAAKALLDRNPKPTEKEVRAALAGNLCRCGAYPKIIESVLGVGNRQVKEQGHGK